MMREAFRTNLPDYIHKIVEPCVMMVLYLPTEMPEFRDLQTGMATLLNAFITKTQKDESKA